MNFWQRTLITVLVFLATAGFFPTYFHVSSVWIACLAAIILGLLNMFVKPLLVILSLPITVMTLGIFYLFINAFMLELTSFLVGIFKLLVCDDGGDHFKHRQFSDHQLHYTK